MSSPDVVALERVRRRWAKLNATDGHEVADRSEELLDAAREAWGRKLPVEAVLTAASNFAARVDEPCSCGGWGYVPVWFAEAQDNGFNAANYKTAFGERPTYCYLCRRGGEQPLDKLEQLPICPTCVGSGLLPLWASNAFLGNAEQARTCFDRVSGWMLGWCCDCGGWGRWREQTTAVSAPLPADAPPPTTPAAADGSTDLTWPAKDGLPLLVRQGRVWSMTFAGRTEHVPHVRGLLYIATLIASERQEMTALDLVAAERLTPSVAIDPAAEGLTVAVHTTPTDRIDHRAVREYKDRLHIVRRELAEAKETQSHVRRNELEEEETALVDQIIRAQRAESDDVRRARDAVSKAIREAIKVIAEPFPELGAHLREAISTGNTVRYRK